MKRELEMTAKDMGDSIASVSFDANGLTIYEWVDEKKSRLALTLSWEDFAQLEVQADIYRNLRAEAEAA